MLTTRSVAVSYFRRAATKINRDPSDLWEDVGVSNEELTAPVLPELA